MVHQIMNEVFLRNYTLNYNLRRHPEFPSRVINTVHYGSESLSVLGPKIWEMLPVDLKDSDSLDSFKSGIKNWWPQVCPCTLCKRYIHRVSFTQISKWSWLLTLPNLILQSWSNTLKQFVCNSQRIVRLCLTVCGVRSWSVNYYILTFFFNSAYHTSLT